MDFDLSYYPYTDVISEISNLIREYIDTGKEELLNKEFINDKWELTNILKAADRRIGKRRLNELSNNILENNYHQAITKIIATRLNK